VRQLLERAAGKALSIDQDKTQIKSLIIIMSDNITELDQLPELLNLNEVMYNKKCQRYLIIIKLELMIIIDDDDNITWL